MVRRKKHWTLFLSLAIVACLCFSCTPTFASVNDVIDKLYPSTQTDPGQLKILIDTYCSAVLGTNVGVTDGFAYNAQQSAFVHLLCSNMGQSSPYFKGNYFKRTSFAQLGFTDIVNQDGYQTDVCTPVSMNNDCDLSKNIPNLLNGIINDYVNIKQASIYGLFSNFKIDADIEINANAFSSGYFDGVQVCGKDKNRYPKTCTMVKGYIKNVKNILSEVTIFSATGVLDIIKTKGITYCSTPATDIFACGLGDQGTSMKSFVNLLYNELFYYRLFMGYYMTMIQRYPSLLINNTYNNDYSAIAKRFSSQYIWSKTALSLTLRMMRDTYMAFPFHVGFTMYQEDLQGFGKILSRIAPPIYTLYDKLKNVQKPK